MTGGNNLFEEKKKQDIFTLETKVAGDKEYDFLIEQDKGIWECELYYIQCDNHNIVKKITACGGGNKELFSYNLVSLTGENYVAVYSASHMGNGDLELFPLDNENSSTYTIDNVIDYQYESMALVDEGGYDYTKSQIYCDGKLDAEYMDVNGDGFTDIVLSGIILRYESYQGEIYAKDYGKLTDSQNCKRTYLYNRLCYREEGRNPAIDSYG